MLWLLFKADIIARQIKRVARANKERQKRLAQNPAEDTQGPAPTTGRRSKLTRAERLALIERQAAKRPLHCRAAWKRTHMMMAKGR